MNTNEKIIKKYQELNELNKQLLNVQHQINLQLKEKILQLEIVIDSLINNKNHESSLSS